MGKHKKRAGNGSAAKIGGIEKEGSLQSTEGITSRNCTAPSTPDELSPALATSRQSGYSMKQDCAGSNKQDPSSNGKAVSLKNGKSQAKAAPLPPGFLESELQAHKRKLKVAENLIDIHRQEIATLKRRLAAAAVESQELRAAKSALESACRAESAEGQTLEKGTCWTIAKRYQWICMGVSFLSAGAVVAMFAMKGTALQQSRGPSQ